MVAEYEENNIAKVQNTEPIKLFMHTKTFMKHKITIGIMQYPITEIVLYKRIDSFFIKK